MEAYDAQWILDFMGERPRCLAKLYKMEAGTLAFAVLGKFSGIIDGEQDDKGKYTYKQCKKKNCPTALRKRARYVDFNP
ncbi:MAG TPA: hypothetical protein PK408_01090 [Treponemataceae bacterium]|nr:hypothetical protein [Treponemataceae bacterium]